MVIGFLVDALIWKKSLKIFNLSTTLTDAYISVGLSVFMKYIPGKVMSILGRSAYIANKKEVSLFLVSTSSILQQILILWAGLFVGFLIFINPDFSFVWSLVSLLFLFFFTIFIIYPNSFLILLKFYSKISSFKPELSNLSTGKIVQTLPLCLLFWLTSGFAFYFYVSSILTQDIPFLLFAGFPLATSLAIITIIAPGGLGIREGILFSILILFNIPAADATMISITSRLWFLLGEALTFFLALFLKVVMKVPTPN